MPSHCHYDNADFLIFWGKQPAFSVAPSLSKIYDAHNRGAKLVCIDPLRFHLAATYLECTEPEWFKSDVWLPIATLRQKSVSVGEALPDSQPAQDGFCA